MLTVAVGLAALLVVQLVMFGMTQRVFLLCAAIVVGAIGWKVFPFEIPHAGQFWKLTGKRAKEAATVAGAPAAGVTLLAVLVSFLYALATDRDALETAGSWAGAGVTVGTAVAAVYWVLSRTVEDAEILRSAQRGTDGDQDM